MSDYPEKKIQVRDYAKADDESVIDYLGLHLNSVQDDVELSWQRFRDTVTYCIERFIPLKGVKKHPCNPWINRDIIQIRRKLKIMKRKHTKIKSAHVNELKSELLANVKDARERFFSHSLADFISNAPQKFWRYLSPSKEASYKIKINAKITEEAHIIAQHFNDYFGSVSFT